MWVGGTKLMDLTHMRSIMKKGSWSISYSPEFVKQVMKARSRKSPVVAKASAELPGVAVDGNDAIERRGWHFTSGVGVQAGRPMVDLMLAKLKKFGISLKMRR